MSDFGRFLNLLGLDSELSERLASRRSQESANYSLDGSIKPGTYRIVHVKTNKVLQIHDEKKEKLNIWDRQTQATNRPGTGKDHWYIQRSGGGYLFKHCRNETYISIALGSGDPYDIRATKYPATWVICSKIGENSESLECVVMTDPTCSKLMSLRSRSESHGANGDTLWLFPPFNGHDQRWRLERIGDSPEGTNSTEQINQLTFQLKKVKEEAEESKSKLNQVENHLSERTSEQDHLFAQLAEANVETSKAKLALLRAQEELDTKEKELAGARRIIDKKDAEIKALERLVPSEREMPTKNEELSKQGLVTREKYRELSNKQEAPGNTPTDHAANPGLEKQSLEITAEEPSSNNARSAPSLKWGEEQLRFGSMSTGGRSRAGTSSRSTGVDAKLADLGWNFDDSE